MNSEYVLCQDCLKVKDYTDERHNEAELCECGGQLCGCRDCNDKALKIIKSSHNKTM